jgi:hypothetical protein
MQHCKHRAIRESLSIFAVHADSARRAMLKCHTRAITHSTGHAVRPVIRNSSASGNGTRFANRLKTSASNHSRRTIR